MSSTGNADKYGPVVVSYLDGKVLLRLSLAGDALSKPCVLTPEQAMSVAAALCMGCRDVLRERDDD